MLDDLVIIIPYLEGSGTTCVETPALSRWRRVKPRGFVGEA